MLKRTLSAKTWVEVSRKALEANVACVRGVLAPATKLMAVVKSNAYGHGLEEVLPIFEKSGADFFGVDSAVEALDMRKRSKKPVLILGYTPPSELKRLAGKEIHQTVYGEESVKVAAGLGASRPLLHLKIETGTSRQGIAIEELPSFLRFWKKFPGLPLTGVSTHFADVEDVSWRGNAPDMSPFAREQMQRFKKALEIIKLLGFTPGLRHMASSAATLFFPETHFDMVRPGICLYGLWPSSQAEKAALRLGSGQGRAEMELKPALTWKTVIAQVKTIEEGESIGYDRAERVGRQTRLAVLPIGYWDGYDRGLSSISEVLIRGKRAKILGRVCMNITMADVTDIPDAKEGDEAVLLGKQGGEEVSAEDFAKKIGTINYEVVTRINPLILRVMAP